MSSAQRGTRADRTRQRSTQFAYLSGIVLVRIVRPITGVIEGQPLSQFMPGLVYDVNPLLAFQLIEIDGAVEEPFADTADVVHEGDMEHMEGPMMGGVHVIQPDSANERSSRRKPRR